MCSKCNVGIANRVCESQTHVFVFFLQNTRLFYVDEVLFLCFWHYLGHRHNYSHDSTSSLIKGFKFCNLFPKPNLNIFITSQVPPISVVLFSTNLEGGEEPTTPIIDKIPKNPYIKSHHF